MSAHSRWDLTDDDVDKNMGVAFQLVMEMLGSAEAHARTLDPAGETALRLAKRLRLEGARGPLAGDPSRLRETASGNFGLPQHPLTFWLASRAQRPWRDRQSSPQVRTIPPARVKARGRKDGTTQR